MERFRAIAMKGAAFLVLAVSICFGQDASQGKDTISGKTSTVNASIFPDLSVGLMQNTFRIAGPSKRVPGKTSVGTVFVLLKPSQSQPDTSAYVLITAAHVLDDIDGQVANLSLRENKGDSDFIPFDYPIIIRSTDGKPLYTRHTTADIAVMFLSIPNAVTIAKISTKILADDKILEKPEVHPGDTVLCLGYPFGLSVNDWGFPILRTGVISPKLCTWPALWRL